MDPLLSTNQQQAQLKFLEYMKDSEILVSNRIAKYLNSIQVARPETTSFVSRLLSNNKHVVTETHVEDVDNDNTEICHLEYLKTYCNTPVELPLPRFNSKHPNRITLPHIGPGVSNLRNPAAADSFTRIAGVVTEMARRYYINLFARYVPVLVDIFIYIQFALPVGEDENNATRAKWLRFLLLALASIAEHKDNNNLQEAVKKVKADMQAYEVINGIKLADAVAYRAKMEINGQGGRDLQAVKRLVNFLINRKDAQFAELIVLLQDLHMFIATEHMAYSNTSQAAPFLIKLNNGKFGFTIRTAIEGLTLPCHHIKDNIDYKPVLVVEDLVKVIGETARTIIVSSNTLYPDLRNVLFRPLEIKVDSYNFVTCEQMTTHEQFRSFINRSDMVKSKITALEINKPSRPIEVREKVNGYQYHIVYNANEDTNSITARYPEAPQLFIGHASKYSFDLIIEYYMLTNGDPAIQLLAVRRFGGLEFKSSESLEVLNLMASSFSFIIKGQGKWEHHRPDGLILQYVNDLYYFKEPDLDAYYDPEDDAFGRYHYYYEKNKIIKERLPWASAIFTNHVTHKNDMYRNGLKKRAIQAHKTFIEEKKKKLTDVYASLSPMHQAVYDNQEKKKLAIEGFYNQPVCFANSLLPPAFVNTIPCIELIDDYYDNKYTAMAHFTQSAPNNHFTRLCHGFNV